MAFSQTDWIGFRLTSFLLSSSTSLLVVLTVILADTRNCGLRRVLTSRPLIWAGRISYGMYLYHHVILFAAFAPEGVDAREVVLPVWIAVLAAGLCLGVPLLSFVLIEAPLLRLKSRLPELLSVEQPSTAMSPDHCARASRLIDRSAA